MSNVIGKYEQLRADVYDLCQQMQEIMDNSAESEEVRGLAYHVQESLNNALFDFDE